MHASREERRRLTVLIMRFHNLSARAPRLADVCAVASLLIACDSAEAGIIDASEEGLLHRWQVQDFSLQSDAWVIVTNCDQIVGYADVRGKDDGEFRALLRVHADYRHRGIELLLLWLIEERIRQAMQYIPVQCAVALSAILSACDQDQHAVFASEGYALRRRFWRLGLVSEENLQGDQLNIDLMAETDRLDIPSAAGRTGMYVARQYMLYQKELRPCSQGEEHSALCMQSL